MPHADTQKLIQYLNEAHATEHALVRVLQSQIAMTPRGSYRSALESHLAETRDHADRVGRRLRSLGQSKNPVTAVIGVVETAVGQAVALAKTPYDLVRGSGGEEKVLKNAKDTCATEALEIATYTAIERLAKAVGDDTTAKLAASIRKDEEQMLERVLREIPQLTVADGLLRHRRDRGGRDREGRAKAVKRSARQARKVPGVAQAEGQVKGAVADESDLAIARYDSLTADEINARLPSSPRSIWPRSTATSVGTRTARPSSTASARSAATSRGPATTSSPWRTSARPSAKPTTTASSACASTSARTRTAPASSRPPSVSSPPSSRFLLFLA